MIITDTIMIGDRFFIRNYSDVGMMIEREGELYSEAIDPIDAVRFYNETDQPIEEAFDDNNFEDFSANP